MGLYFSAVDWFAITGAGTQGDGLRDDRGGVLERSLGRGEVIAVPKGENEVGLKGSGAIVRFVGWDVIIGGIVNIQDEWMDQVN